MKKRTRLKTPKRIWKKGSRCIWINCFLSYVEKCRCTPNYSIMLRGPSLRIMNAVIRDTFIEGIENGFWRDIWQDYKKRLLDARSDWTHPICVW